MAENKEHLQRVLESHAQSEDQRRTVAKLIQNAEVHGATSEAVELMLCGLIADGLRYGNWPWLVFDFTQSRYVYVSETGKRTR